MKMNTGNCIRQLLRGFVSETESDAIHTGMAVLESVSLKSNENAK